MQGKVVTIFGGTGFLGRYVVRELAKAGATIRVASRFPESGKGMKTAGNVGQVVLVHANIQDRDSVAQALDGSYAVVNLIGLLHESGRQKFATVHAQGAERLAKAAKAAGVQKFVHVSAIGVDRPTRSKYARTKATGEKAIISAFPEATILRPSVIFGQEDNFFNKFAGMARFFPALPLIGGGKTRFQPVYVGDVARAITTVIARGGHAGKIYELGGPEIYSFRQILEYILRVTGYHRWLVSIPFSIAGLLGAFLEWLPKPPLTRDQVALLRDDNVVGEKAQTLEMLGITPTALESVVPEYLAMYRKGGQFAQ